MSCTTTRRSTSPAWPTSLPRAEVEPELAARVKELALAAYRAVDCAGLARVDFLVPPGAVYLSEMNTLPGFTATSMYPKQAELAGLGVPGPHRAADRARAGVRARGAHAGQRSGRPAGRDAMTRSRYHDARRGARAAPARGAAPASPLRRRVRRALPAPGRIAAGLLAAVLDRRPAGARQRAVAARRAGSPGPGSGTRPATSSQRALADRSTAPRC